MGVKASSQLTLMDYTDGISVHLSSEAYTFLGNTTGATSGSCTTEVMTERGNERVAHTIGNITCPTGITATKSTNSSTNITTITFTISSGSTISNSCEATIPVTIGSGDDAVTINKKFSFSVSKTGAKGDKGDTGTAITGIKSMFKLNNSTTAPTIDSSWGENPSAPTTSNKYLWSYEIISYSNNTTTNTAAHIVGTYGETGTAGSKWTQGTALTGTSGSIKGVAGAVGDNYLNTSTGNTYRCVTAGTATTAIWNYAGNIKGVKGDTGDAGEDAIVLVIEASPSNIIKNSSTNVTLKARVFKGGDEVTAAADIAALGTIKWYKGENYLTGKDGISITVTPTDINKLQSYTAQLEVADS